MQIVKWKGFPKPSKHLARAKASAKLIKKSAKLDYSMFQIPQGLIMGVRIQTDTNSCTLLDMYGKTLEISLGELEIDALMKAINKIFLDDKEYPESTLTFWFVCGGGKSDNEAIYGSDLLDSFMFLILVTLDGSPMSPNKWSKVSNPEARVFNVQDFLVRELNLTGNSELVRKKIKDYLKIDLIHKQLTGPGRIKRSAYAVFLIPNDPFLRRRPESWAFIKANSNYVKE